MRAIDQRLARRELPDIAHRQGLRACAAIGAGCRQAHRGIAAFDPTCAAIIALGEEAAALLRRVPGSTALGHSDRDAVARDPQAGRPQGPLVRRMARLVERYRQEGEIDRLDLELTLLAAYAHCVARG